MKSLGLVLRETTTDVYILNEADKRFIGSFGSPSNPVGLAEFLMFWNTLDDADKAAIMLDYEPGCSSGTEGFKG